MIDAIGEPPPPLLSRVSRHPSRSPRRRGSRETEVVSKRRAMAHIRSVKAAESHCPNCLRILDGVTGARVGGFFPGSKLRELKGRPTMCAYCGALLIFADDAGRVRIMTEEERNSVRFAPIVEQLHANWREKLRAEGEALTKRSYN